MQYPKQTDNYDVDIFNSNFREIAEKDTELDGKIEEETNRATAAESDIADDLAEETSRATSREDTIENNLNAETQAIRQLIDTAYTSANGYTDEKISQLINGAPSTLDTLGEIANAMQDNADVIEALEQAIGSKAIEADFAGHAGNNIIHITGNEREYWNAANGMASASLSLIGGIGAKENVSGPYNTVNPASSSHESFTFIYGIMSLRYNSVTYTSVPYRAIMPVGPNSGGQGWGITPPSPSYPGVIYNFQATGFNNYGDIDTFQLKSISPLGAGKISEVSVLSANCVSINKPANEIKKSFTTKASGRTGTIKLGPAGCTIAYYTGVVSSSGNYFTIDATYEPFAVSVYGFVILFGSAGFRTIIGVFSGSAGGRVMTVDGYTTITSLANQTVTAIAIFTPR